MYGRKLVFESNFPSTRLYWFGGGFNAGFFCVTSLGGLFLEGLIFGILRYAVSSVSIA